MVINGSMHCEDYCEMKNICSILFSHIAITVCSMKNEAITEDDKM